VGMGAQLAASSPRARQLFDRAADVLGYNLLDLCTEGPAEKLNSTVHSQPALYVCSLAALEQFRDDAPDVVDGCRVTAGLSLGEYTALVFAGAMTFDAGLRLVQVRGQAMQDASDAMPSGMVSVLGMEREQVTALCDEARGDEVLQLANLLCPGNIVVSGSRAACERIAQAAKAAGAIKVLSLSVAGAFHTPIMQPAVERLTSALSEVEFSVPRVPVVSNVDALPHEDPNEIRALLIQQVVSPVLWEDSMRWLLDEFGVDGCCEIGPGRVLRGLLKRINRKIPCENIEA